MKTKLVCIRDIKVGAYGQPVNVPSIGAAIRSFEDACKPGAETDVSKHPTDFELYHLGDYDDQTGNIEVNEKPIFLTKGETHVQK